MRESGILFPIFSVPSKFGIGSFSREAYEFADFLEKSGQGFWQILPIGPTGFGDSPYQPFSSFAGQPLIISVDHLRDLKLLVDSDFENMPQWNPEDISYGDVIAFKTDLFKKPLYDSLSNISFKGLSKAAKTIICS